MSENDNHPQEYTPTTAQVRAQWLEAYLVDAMGDAAFDRFLAEVRAEAWDEGHAAHLSWTLPRPRRSARQAEPPMNPHRSLSPSTPNPEPEGQP